MRQTLIAVAILSAVACASTGTVGPTEYFAADFDIVWAAAIDAAHSMGARIRVENRAAGMIAATIASDSAGGGINLNISVSKQMRGAEVQVNVREAGVDELDDLRQRELRDLESRYLQLVSDAVLRLQGRYGRGPQPY